MSLETWKIDVDNFIPKLVDGEINENNAILLNALFGLKRQFSHMSKESNALAINSPESAKYEPQDSEDVDLRLETIDFIPNSRIDNLKQESLIQFIEFMKHKGLEQTSGAAEYHRELAETAIAKMLEIDEQIAEMLYKSSDEREKKLIEESYVRLLNALFGSQNRFKTSNEINTEDGKKASRSDEYKATEQKEIQWIIDSIQDELADSQKYYDKYLETQFGEYKNIARDELRHAEVGMKRAREYGVSDNELQDFTILHGVMMARLA